MPNTDQRTHYIPAMTRRDDQGRQQTICGAFTTPDQHRVDPAELTCWGCQMWMQNIDAIEPETAKELRTR